MAKTHTLPATEPTAEAKTGTIGDNIAYRLEGNKLTLECDLSKELGPSKSQKTMLVASTKGNANVGPVTVGLNIYKKITGA